MLDSKQMAADKPSFGLRTAAYTGLAFMTSGGAIEVGNIARIELSQFPDINIPLSPTTETLLPLIGALLFIAGTALVVYAGRRAGNRT